MAERNRFSKLLKHLMSVTSVKNYTLAQELQYDVSYISKWTSGQMIPSEKIEKKVLKGISSCIVDAAGDSSKKKLLQDYQVENYEDLKLAIFDNLEAEYFYVKELQKNTGMELAPKTAYFAELTLSQYIAKMRHPVLRRVNALTIVGAVDILSMDREYQLQITETETEHAPKGRGYPDVHYYMMIDIKQEKWDYIYDTTAEQEETLDGRIAEVLDKLQVDKGTDIEKIRAVYDYICQHTAYDYENLSNDEYKLKYTAYAAMMDGKAVCQGYALLLYRLLLELNVDSRLIAGTGNGEAHGWNIVGLNDVYYNVDTTWDAGTTEYEYFLKSEASFTDHVRDDDYTTDEFNTSYPMAVRDYSEPEPSETESETETETEIETETETETETEIETETEMETETEIETETEAEIEVPEIPETPVITSVYSRVQTSAKVCWTIVEDADGYELYRALSADASEEDWCLTKTIKDGSIDYYTNNGLTPGKTYYYKIRAYTENEDTTRSYSAFSSVSYMPATVVWDNVYSNSTSRIRLLWQEVQGAHGYQIWRRSSDGDYVIVKTLGDRDNVLTNDQGSITAYSNTGLTAGETYTYRMRAFAIVDGQKIYSVWSDEYTAAVMPETPVLSLSTPKTDRAVLSWTEVNGAAGYQIWRAESENGPYAVIKSINSGDTLSYTNSGLSEGITYYYKIRAYTQAGEQKTFGEYSAVQVRR